MDFAHFVNQTLGPLGFDLVSDYHCYNGPYNPVTGWPLKFIMPDRVTENTLILLHFNDFVTQNNGKILELEKIRQHYGELSSRVLVTHWTSDLEKFYQGPINLIKFSNHNYDIVNELVRRYEQWKYILSLPKTHAWQCLNGRMCSHRLTVMDILKNWSNGWLSYGTEISLPSHAYNCYIGCENFDNFLKLDYIYGSAKVNIVTETEYQPPTGIVTEKTLYAFAAEQIPIIIGHQGIVAQCQAMGFDMFDDLVDVSYDQMPNEIRAQRAIELNRDLILGLVDLEPFKDRLIQQKEFLLTQFTKKIEQDFVQAAHQLTKKLLPVFKTF
jgi:hypothetical protein